MLTHKWNALNRLFNYLMFMNLLFLCCSLTIQADEVEDFSFFQQKKEALAGIIDSLEQYEKNYLTLKFNINASDAIEKQKTYGYFIGMFTKMGQWYTQIGNPNGYINTWNYKADIALGMHEVEQALVYTEEGLAQVRTNPQIEVADSVLGRLYLHRGRAWARLGQADSALFNLNQKAKPKLCNGENHRACIELLHFEAYAYFGASDFTAMEAPLEEAILLSQMHLSLQQKENVVLLSKIHNLLATAYNAQGKYNQCIERTRQALQIFNQHRQAKDSETLLWLYYNLAAAYLSREDYALAEEYIKQALSYAKEVSLPNGYSVITTTGVLGNIYIKLEHFEKALDLLLPLIEAEDQWRDMPHQTDKEKLLINLHLKAINAYIALDKKKSAYEHLEKVMPLCQKNNYKLVDLYYLRSKWSKEQQQYHKALVQLRQAIAVYHQNKQGSQVCLAELYLLQGQIAEQQQEFTQSFIYCQKALLEVSGWLLPNNAKAVSNKELQWNEITNELVLLQTLALKARALYQQNPLKQSTIEQALSILQLASAVVDTIRQNYYINDAKYRLVTQAMPIYEQAIQLAFQLYDLTNDKKYQKIAFYFSEKGKASILLEQVQETKAKQVIKEIPPSLFYRIDSIQRNYWLYRKKCLTLQTHKSSIDSLKRSNWQQTMLELKEELVFLKQTLARKHTRYHKLKQGLSISNISDVQVSLQTLDASSSQQHAIIEYFIGEEQAYVLALTARNYHIKKITPPKPLNDLLQRFKISLQTDTISFETYADLAHQTYQYLVQPIEQELVDIDALIIVPDGQINYLPFEALLTKAFDTCIPEHPRHAAYLLQDYIISYTSSATLWQKQLAQKAQPTITTSRYLGFAPTFEGVLAEQLNPIQMRGNCRNDYAPLHYNTLEVTQIADLLKGTARLGGEATKQTFQKEAATTAILHLATHACVNDTFPMFSEIQFAEQQLRTHELFGLSLQNTELAVLSACQTGTGDWAKGEGVMSLSRAFMYAGCPSLVHSLWNATDKSTSEIMIEFYRYMNQGLSKPAALRQAKLDFLANSLIPAHQMLPVYWATFIQNGNPNPISFAQETSIPTFRYYWLFWTITFIGIILFSVKVHQYRRSQVRS